MPQRTRQQKIRSYNRRTQHVSQGLDTSAEGNTVSYTFSAKETAARQAAVYNPRAQTLSQSARQDAVSVKKDIQKIVIFTASLLALEFLLYWMIEIKQFIKL